MMIPFPTLTPAQFVALARRRAPALASYLGEELAVASARLSLRARYTARRAWKKIVERF